MQFVCTSVVVGWLAVYLRGVGESNVYPKNRIALWRQVEQPLFSAVATATIIFLIGQCMLEQFIR